jgi:outer membrane protein assembly factor BamB
LSQRIRVIGAVLGLLSLSVMLSACGAAPVAQNWPGLTLAGDTIYVISGQPQQVYLLDIETGTQKAVFMPQGEHRGVVYWSPVAVGGDLAFVGFADSQAGTAGLYAFDPTTGQEQWHVAAVGLIIPAPVYADGVVYFGSSDGFVYAVDVETKSIKPGWPFKATEAIWASPLIAGDRVYVAAQNHYLYCLDAQTGQEIWKYQVGGAMAAQPTLDAVRGILYVGAFDGKIYAIKADTGERLEGFDFRAKNWIWSEALVANDQVYATSLDGQLYALDPLTGAVSPPYPYNSGDIEGKNDAIRAAPVRAGASIIVATESGRVIAVKDAVRQWVWPSGLPQAGVLTTPVVSGDKIYVVLLNGVVQTLDAETGVQGWTFSPPTAQ